MDANTVARAASVLAGAFYDDPVVTYLWPNDATRRQRTELSFGLQLRHLQARRVVHIEEDRSAVAVCARPHEWEIPAATQVRLAPGVLRSRPRLRGLVALTRADKLHPTEPHWYLEYLGTDPSRQGKGLGGKALAPLLAQADADGLPVWAWSSNRQNLSFYHRHGFVVLDEVPFAKGGPPIFPIRREPAPL